MANANIVDHIGGKVTVWTKDGNAAENRTLHTVDDFGVVISNQHGKQTFIPWGQVKYIDYSDESLESVAEAGCFCFRKLSEEECKEYEREWTVESSQSTQQPPVTNVNSERPGLLQQVTAKALSDELSVRTGVQKYQLSPGELMNIEQGGGIRTLSGPAIVLFNQD